MQRRTVLQVIAAFFAGLAGWFGFGREQPFELVRLKSPLGVVSPKARWFLSPTQEIIAELNPDRARELLTAIQEGVALFPPSTQVDGPFLFKADPEYVPEPQQGREVMRLKNPAVQSTILGADPGGPPPEYMTPTKPVTRSASSVWEPLTTFHATPSHPALTPMGIVLGTLRNPSTAARVDISDDATFRAITGRKLDDAPEVLDPKIQAEIDANLSELMKKWERLSEVSS
jgi:hypothetical protein